MNTAAGVESMYCAVRGTHNFNMDPSWYFTNKKLEEYMPLAVGNRWDTVKVGTKLEAYAVAKCDNLGLFSTIVLSSTSLFSSVALARSAKDKAVYYKSAIRERMNSNLSKHPIDLI